MREAVRKTVPAQIKTHFSFRSCAKRETVLGLQREKGAHAMDLCTVTGLVIAIVGRGTNPDTIVGLRAAAARGRRRRHGISAAALFAGSRKAGPQKANAARWDSLSPLFPRGAASLGAAWLQNEAECFAHVSLLHVIAHLGRKRKRAFAPGRSESPLSILR